MKVLSFLLVTLFYSSFAFSQDQQKVDSLLNVLDTEISKEERVDTYVGLARAYNNIDTLKVVDFAEKAWAISEEISYINGMADVWNIRGYIAVEITDLDRAMKLFEKGYELAEKVNYMRGMSISLAGQGIVKWKSGQYDESLQVLNESLDKLSKSDGPKDFVPIYNSIALVHYLKGDYDKAIEYFQECIKIYEASGNESGLGRLLMNTGVMYVSKGENRESLAYYKRALEIQKKYGQKNNMAGTLNNIGVAYKNLGNLDSALVIYRQSMKLNLELGLKTGVAQLYNNIGAIHLDRGVSDSAEFYFKKAIVSYEEISDFYNASMTYRNVGHIYFNKGNYPKALEYYLIALRMAKEIDAKSLEGEFLNAIGKVYQDQGETDEALAYYRQAVEISISTENNWSTAEIYSSIGILYESNNIDSAIFYHKSSLKLNEGMGYEFGISQNYLDLGACYEKKGQYPLALTFIDKSLAITQFLGLQVKEATGLLQKGEILLKQNKLQSALRIVKEGVLLTKETRNLTNERYGTSLLVRIYESLGNFEEAFKSQVMLGQLSDSIFNEANTKELARVEAQYEFEKEKIINEKAFENELSIQQAKQEKQFIILLIAIASGLIITVLLLILYRRYTLIQNKNKIIEEQKNQVEIQAQKLQALDISKSNFFANISHDLRSPLTLILGSMDQVLDEEKELSFSGKELLESGYRNGKKLLFMTDEIRDLSRLQEGKLQLKLQLVKIVPYINLLVKMFSSAAYFKKIVLKFESHIEEDKIVKIDPHQFEKIIYNLLSNAVKHTPEYGNITVQLNNHESDPNKILIEVVDTGIGIPADQINHVFDRYYQVPSQVLGENVGFGIGLALCKEIADLHQSNISAVSNENEGTTFKINLSSCDEESTSGFVVDEYYEPIYAPLMEAQPEEEKETANTNPIKEKTVLIVEDHREIRRYIDNLLNKEYHTLLAKNGEEALTLLKSEKVDIIISDLMMPYIDGFELLKQLKAEENYAHIPVLIVSARTNEEDKLEILKLGAEEIIAKPFTPSEIKLRLQNLLSKASNNSVLHLFDPSNVKSGVEHIISDKVKQLILDRIDDANLSVMDFCEVLAASERKVFRLIKKIFNLTPLELIKETRWQYLDTLLKSGTKMSASESGRSIGMRNVTNFKKQFSDRFGKPYEE